MLVDNARRKREKIALRMVAPCWTSVDTRMKLHYNDPMAAKQEVALMPRR